MKKILSIMMSFMFILTAVIPANATSFIEDDFYVSSELFELEKSTQTEKNKSVTVLTKHSNGQIIQEEKDFSNRNTATFQFDKKPMILEPITPDNNTISYSSSTNSRGQVTQSNDPRTGVLECGFDTNNDGYSDVWFDVTASIQGYDIVVSCAHGVWMSQYQYLDCEGWANDLYFYAGCQNISTYLDVSSYVSVSISMGWIENTEYITDVNGNLVEVNSTDDDWSIIQIEDNFGSRFGAYGLHGCGTPEMNVPIYVIGYPESKPDWSQWKSTGNIIGFENYTMYYDAFVEPGNSGSPILNSDLLYGIVGGGIVDYYTGNYLNGYGVRMFPELFGMIAEAREESEERWL
ncbi:MAG: hypothetical protein U0M02_05485 [Acutalibacteraceae bacterium]|nr:hypothetical protein [Acutalibacteraceae bacterium]